MRDAPMCDDPVAHGCGRHQAPGYPRPQKICIHGTSMQEHCPWCLGPRLEKPPTVDRENNLVAAGAVLALLSDHAAGRWSARPSQLTAAEVVTDVEGNVTNQIDIRLSFMKSPYRLTIERVDTDRPTV